MHTFALSLTRVVAGLFIALSLASAALAECGGGHAVRTSDSATTTPATVATSGVTTPRSGG